MYDRAGSCRSLRMPAAFAAYALLTFAAAGCGQKETYGEASGDGLLSGYEIGNQQDIQDLRKDRPDHVPFE